ncbi:MAG: integrase [Gammaproteobacteria bacterium RIFCSPLOWO2_02_FULL_57_10]|nr:MAG: integrase [Gammaproteobacteria bacterium RIFCSPLOWO2_02_FULL_57_10]
MSLSVLKIKTAKPTEKDFKLADEKGLYLLVKTNGSKYWRLKYRIEGKEKLMALGVYPEVSLSKARERRDSARALVADGIDPMANKRAIKASDQAASTNSFEIVANEWLSKRGKKSKGGDARLTNLLQKDLLPWLGKRPIDKITPVELLEVLRRVEERGAIETAHRAKQYVGLIFRYAVATGRVERDISADLRGALKTTSTTHFASITAPKEVGKLLVAIDQYEGTPAVHAALKLSPLLFCRPGELRHLEWSEVNWEESFIEIPAHKMKMNQPHIIPLCTQALQILKALQPITARSTYVFPSARGASRPLSENGVRTALRNMGYTNEQMTPHGFRALARTLLDEVLEVPVEWIEQQLAHSVKDANGRAYNRTKHLKQRKEMMQRWGDYLDKLKETNR